MATTLTPYLSFDGHTRVAFAFYEHALGAKIEDMMSCADMPPSTTSGDGGAEAGMASGDQPHTKMPKRCILFLTSGPRLLARSLHQPGECP